MPNYVRNRQAGGTYFFTVVTNNRIPLFNQPEARTILREAWKSVSSTCPFATEAICLLPDHLHCILTLPKDDTDYSFRLKRIKAIFSKEYQLRVSPITQRSVSQINRKEFAIWQRRFWEHTIQDEMDYQNHFDYIHFNPVKHGYVKRVRNWPWSSFHRYVKQGIYPVNWGDLDEKKFNGIEFGE